MMPNDQQHETDVQAVADAARKESTEDETNKKKEPRVLGRKRQRRANQRSSTIAVAYEGFEFLPTSTKATPVTPGTPESLFGMCYRVQHQYQDNSGGLVLRLHQHPNGLIVVALEVVRSSQTMQMLTGFEYQIQPVSSTLSAAQKRKQNELLERGRFIESGNSSGVVRPSDTLITLHVKNTDTPVHIPCGILGTVLEINERLSVELLQEDSLLNGYLAIVLPAGGRFPPAGLADICDKVIDD